MRLLPLLAALAAAQARGTQGGLDRVSPSILQIAVVQRTRELLLRPEGAFSAVEQRTGRSSPLESRRDYELRAGEGSRFAFGPYRFEGPVRLVPGAAEDWMRVGPKKYQGSLLLRPNPDATLSVISELGLEEYLHGVLPAEMSPDWPPEALKAQAVVARTFALNNLDKFRDSGFDLSNDSRSQVYDGLDSHDPRAIRAVRETAGLVLTWKGRLLPAFFHSCCGGRTASHAAVWGGPRDVPRPLRGVADRFCSASPHYAWSAYFPSDAVLAALQRHRLPVARLKGVRIGSTDPSGIVRTLRVRADGSWLEVRTADLRSWLGPGEFKSARLLRVVEKRKGYVFIGRGFGHGVGLCQWGARGMAERGRDYRKILRYYFPGAELSPHEG